MLKLVVLSVLLTSCALRTLAVVEAFSSSAPPIQHRRCKRTTSSLCKRVKSNNTDEPTTSSESLSSIRYRLADPDDKLPKTFDSLISASASASDQIIVLAEDSKDKNRLIAWVRIQSLGYAIIPDTTTTELLEDDDNYNNKYYNTLQRREVVSSVSDVIESDVNEQLWEEFEDDPTPIPTGLASLPWTSEYRAASKAAANRRERRDELMEREEQNAKRNRPRIWELTFEFANNNQELERCESDKLLETLFEEYSKQKYSDNDEVYVLAPLSLVPLFVQEQFGFVEVRRELIPSALSSKLTFKNMSMKLFQREEILCLKQMRS
jgi:hypothetical protein